MSRLEQTVTIKRGRALEIELTQNKFGEVGIRLPVDPEAQFFSRNEARAIAYQILAMTEEQL